MTSPIKQGPSPPPLDPNNLPGGRRLTSREYLYRNPEREDIKVAVIKLICYGGIVWAAGSMMDNAVDGFRVLLISLLVMSAVMILDAIFGGLYRVSLRKPSLADYFFPMQNASWGLLPGSLLYIGGMIGVLVGLSRIIF